MDVIVGNPPWASADLKEKEDKKAVKWFDNKPHYPISDNERSQMFIWRSYDFLKPDGVAALLVSSGTLFKSSPKSNIFKQSWTTKSTLVEIYNFVLTRYVFFENAISPFFGVVFRKRKPNLRHKINYWTLKKSKVVENNQVVLLDKSDFKVIPQSKINTPDIWKIYQLGKPF